MNHDDVLKLKAAVLYVVNKCGEIGYFHLFKILYFANREHYAKYGRGIIKDTFCALPKGPVPSFLFDAVKNLSSTQKGGEHKVISDSLYNQDPTYYYLLSAKELPDMDELSKSDIQCLDESIKDNKDLEVNILSNKSHDEAWGEAKITHGRMNNLSIAKAGGANEAMLEYIKENELIDSLIG